jgi:hypothetical protein
MAPTTAGSRDDRPDTGPDPATRPDGDVLDVVLCEALRPGAAAPTAIHIRPELYARFSDSPESGGPAPAPLRRADIPVVIDDEIPRSPGYEIHRAPPTSATAHLAPPA